MDLNEPLSATKPDTSTSTAHLGYQGNCDEKPCQWAWARKPMLHTVPRHKEWIGLGHGQDKSMSETYCPQVATNLPTPQMFLYSSSRCRKKEIPSLSFCGNYWLSGLTRRGQKSCAANDDQTTPRGKNERILSKAQHEKNKTGTGQEFQHPQGLVAVPIRSNEWIFCMC